MAINGTGTDLEEDDTVLITHLQDLFKIVTHMNTIN
jgi:hypothetical protein